MSTHDSFFNDCEKDYRLAFKELNIKVTTNKSKVKSAFWKLAIKCHPDKTKTDKETAEKTFKRLAHSRDVCNRAIDSGEVQYFLNILKSNELKTVQPPLNDNAKHSSQKNNTDARKSASNIDEEWEFFVADENAYASFFNDASKTFLATFVLVVLYPVLIASFIALIIAVFFAILIGIIYLIIMIAGQGGSMLSFLLLAIGAVFAVLWSFVKLSELSKRVNAIIISKLCSTAYPLRTTFFTLVIVTIISSVLGYKLSETEKPITYLTFTLIVYGVVTNVLLSYKSTILKANDYYSQLRNKPIKDILQERFYLRKDKILQIE